MIRRRNTKILNYSSTRYIYVTLFLNREVMDNLWSLDVNMSALFLGLEKYSINCKIRYFPLKYKDLSIKIIPQRD